MFEADPKLSGVRTLKISQERNTNDTSTMYPLVAPDRFLNPVIFVIRRHSWRRFTNALLRFASEYSALKILGKRPDKCWNFSFFPASNTPNAKIDSGFAPAGFPLAYSALHQNQCNRLRLFGGSHVFWLFLSLYLTVITYWIKKFEKALFREIYVKSTINGRP